MEKREFVWEYKGGMLRVEEDEICYFHSERRKTYIHTPDKIYELRGNLKDAEKKVGGLPMVRTHVSFLIHLKHLRNLTGSEAVMRNGDRIPVSEKRRKYAFETARIYFFSKENEEND